MMIDKKGKITKRIMIGIVIALAVLIFGLVFYFGEDMGIQFSPEVRKLMDGAGFGKVAEEEIGQKEGDMGLGYEGDLSEEDSDNDGIPDIYDKCIGNGIDSDGDGVDDNCDNCPNNYNQDQGDIDEDGVGDECDPDYDDGDDDDDDGGGDNWLCRCVLSELPGLLDKKGNLMCSNGEDDDCDGTIDAPPELGMGIPPCEIGQECPDDEIPPYDPSCCEEDEDPCTANAIIDNKCAHVPIPNCIRCVSVLECINPEFDLAACVSGKCVFWNREQQFVFSTKGQKI